MSDNRVELHRLRSTALHPATFCGRATISSGLDPLAVVGHTGLMWIELIQKLTPDATFHPAASQQALEACERTLGRPLVADLAALVRETNGVEGAHGLALVWPVERISEDKIAFRTTPDFADLYMPFDPMLFFADAVNGDQFAFVLRDRPDDVFVWDHETDSRTMVTGGLAAYLTGWLDGSLKI